MSDTFRDIIKYIEKETEQTRQRFAANVAIQTEKAVKGEAGYISHWPEDTRYSKSLFVGESIHSPGAKFDKVELTNDAETPRPGRPKDKRGVHYPVFHQGDAEKTIDDNFSKIVDNAAQGIRD